MDGIMSSALGWVAPFTDEDLNKLYKLVADKLDISPTAEQHQTFKKIFSGCSTLVDGLAAIRNSLGDAHGKGEQYVMVKIRHAELAVNIAGSIATYLISTYEEKADPTQPSSKSLEGALPSGQATCPKIGSGVISPLSIAS